jgi:hypothetical protein
MFGLPELVGKLRSKPQKFGVRKSARQQSAKPQMFDVSELVG